MRPGEMGPSFPPGKNRQGFVRRLDRDGDGRVSPTEFDGPAEAFDYLDANQVGYLDDSASPAKRGLGPQQRPLPAPRHDPGKKQS